MIDHIVVTCDSLSTMLVEFGKYVCTESTLNIVLHGKLFQKHIRPLDVQQIFGVLPVSK
jgi:hypothetical protein